MNVAQAFAKAAGYDDHASVQREVATKLATTIASLPSRGTATILEVGCGTGFLGEALIPHLPAARWTMTDLAPEMLARASVRLTGQADIHFTTMDGQAPDQSGPFDLICSSLAFQWFADLPRAVARLRDLLAPGGHLAFTTLAQGCFSEWRDAHRGAACGVPDYPSRHALQAMGLDVAVQPHRLQFESARAFLRHLKGIGATVPRAGYRPIGPAAMQQIIRDFETQGARVTYQVATCIMRG